ncbi:hypothetical protein FB639_002004 [Coemansia asiatica]|nr:hypothetical protein FB639_002004 [Coemansia asiatica]
MSFYWTVSSFSFFVDDILVIKRAYFSKEEVDILNDVMLDHLIFQPDVPYNNLDAESIWSLTLQATPHTDVTYAEMLSRLRKLEHATEGKYAISEVNNMHKRAIKDVVLRLGSLHFNKPESLSANSACGSQIDYMQIISHCEGIVSKMISVENLGIIKALLRYKMHRRIFRRGSDAHLLFLSLPLQAQSIISGFSDIELCLWMLVCRHGSSMIGYIDMCISQILDAYVKVTNNLDAEDYGYLLSHGNIPKGYPTKILKRIVEEIHLLPFETSAKQEKPTTLSKNIDTIEHHRSSVSITSNINITNVLDQLLSAADNSTETSTATSTEASTAINISASNAKTSDTTPLSGSTSSEQIFEPQPASLVSPLSSSINVPLFNTKIRRRASMPRPNLGNARHYKQPSQTVSFSLPESLPQNLFDELFKMQ